MTTGSLSTEFLFHQVVQNLPGVVFILDRSGVFTLFAGKSLAVLGLKPDQMVGLSVFEVYKDIPSIGISVQRALAGEEHHAVVNIGELIFDTHYTPIKDGEQISGIIGIATDITSYEKTESEKVFLNNIIESLSNPFYVINAQDYSIEIANSAARELGIGRGVSTCYALTHHREMPCDGLEHPCPLARVHSTKEPTVVQHLHYDKSGALRNMEVHGYPILDAQGEVIQMIEYSIDITERVRMDDALRTSEQRLALLVEQSPLAVIEWNLDFEVTLWNPAAEQIFGFTSEEALGRHAIDLVAPEERRLSITQAWQELLQSKGGNRSTQENSTKGGRTITCEWYNTPLLDAKGQIFGVSSLVVDISEREQVEQALRTSEQRFRSLFEHSADATMILEGDIWLELDEISIAILECNQAMADLLGYASIEELLIVHPTELWPVQQPGGELSVKLMDQAVKTALDQGNYRFEWVFQRPSGEEFFADILFTIIPLDDRKVIYTVVRDTTDRKKVEQQIQESLERRSSQLRISTEIAQEIANAPELGELFRRVVTLIKDRFGYYHTQIFRYDPISKAIVLVVGYGSIGEQMLAQGHKLDIGTGLIGAAANTGSTVLRSDLRGDQDWKPNPLLPETRGEIAVPIKLANQTLGVLDVQSDHANALDDDDRLLLEGLCGEIAIFIETTRLRQEMQDRLHELDNLYQATSRQGWESFLAASDRETAYYFDHAQTSVRPEPTLWSEETRLAVSQNTLVPVKGEHSVLTAPLSIRQNVIGALAIEFEKDEPLSEDELALVQELSEQISLALESARLYEQTQAALGESQTLYNIIAEMNAAQSYQDILQALDERTLLGQADQLLLMGVFERPLSDKTLRPEWIIPVAYRCDRKIVIAPRYPLSAFESEPNSLFLSNPVMVSNIDVDSRLDKVTRILFTEVFKAQSFIVVPLLLGEQVIGFVQGYFSGMMKTSENELQRLAAIAGQAAIAVQSHLLLEQAQARARQEERIRTVTSQIFGAADVDTVMRRAAEQVGRVLGTPAFVYLQETSKQPDSGEGKND